MRYLLLFIFFWFVVARPGYSQHQLSLLRNIFIFFITDFLTFLIKFCFFIVPGECGAV